jgi:hypothetical protein
LRYGGQLQITSCINKQYATNALGIKALAVNGKVTNPTMLEFYLIKDDQSKPNNPRNNGLEFIGGLDENTFEDLQHREIIDRRFDYYSNFRWDTSVVRQLKETIKQKQTNLDNNIKQLLELLEKASNVQSGLIAYGD